MSSDSEVSPEVIDGLHDRDHDIDDEHDTTGIVKGDSIDGKIMYVWNLLRSNPEYRLRLRFMLISETVILRVYKGRLYEYRQLKPLTVIRDMTWNRGKILETFIKLEIMTTELLILGLIGIFERDPKLERHRSSQDKTLRGCGFR